MYGARHILAQIFTANHVTIPIQMYAITVHICGNFWGTQYSKIKGEFVTDYSFLKIFLIVTLNYLYIE